MRKYVLSAAIFVSALSATAATPKETGSMSLTPEKYFEMISSVAPYDATWKETFPKESQAQVEKSNKAMKEQENKRSIASELDPEFFESKMSPAFKKFREQFLAAKTADDLENLLVTAEANYESYPADLQFIAAQFIPLRSLRGIVWRVVPTVEKSKAVHSVLLTQVKNMAVGIKILLPTDQWTAGFAYITQPFIESGIAPFKNKGQLVRQFEKANEADVQSYVRGVVIPMLTKSAARLEKLDLSAELSAWDNKLLYGTGTFPSALDRYALVGEVERHAALTNIYAMLSELNYQSAYSMQGALAMNQEISKLYGFDGVFSRVDGVPANKRVAIIKSDKYSNWGRLFSDGSRYLNDAWFHLQKSVEHGDMMWQAMKNRPVSEMYAIENSYVLPFQRPIANRFESLKRIVSGPTTVRSFITDETVKINLKDFYLNPPSSLRDLYPVAFEGGTEMISKSFGTGKEAVTVKYRNFTMGRPTGWNLKVYNKYFPDVKTDKDLEKSVRVLTQGWGTFVIASPMMQYMN